jgi:hypothetical protein
MKSEGAPEEPPKVLLSTPGMRAVLVSDRIAHSDKVRRQVVIERLEKDAMGGDRWMERMRHSETDSMTDLLINGVR